MAYVLMSDLSKKADPSVKRYRLSFGENYWDFDLTVEEYKKLSKTISDNMPVDKAHLSGKYRKSSILHPSRLADANDAPLDNLQAGSAVVDKGTDGTGSGLGLKKRQEIRAWAKSQEEPVFQKLSNNGRIPYDIYRAYFAIHADELPADGKVPGAKASSITSSRNDYLWKGVDEAADRIIKKAGGDINIR